MTSEDAAEKILVLDFGGQYDQLIARRVRDQHVYAEIKDYRRITAEEIKNSGYAGIIFTGGPASVYAPGSPSFDPTIFDLGIPILGICYGVQLMAYLSGATVASAEEGEYGSTEVTVTPNALFAGVPETSRCFMSHRDRIVSLPVGFEVTAHTDSCPIAALANDEKKLYGVQFHPEVEHTEYGGKILNNFLYGICGCTGRWQMDDFISESVAKYSEELRGRKVLLALSGGVDSSVTAALLSRAVGSGLNMVFVDHGMMRKDEGDYVESVFKDHYGAHFIRVNAADRFLGKLKGVTDPEKKRKIIGEEFIRVFEEEALKLGRIDVLAQGTIYPDVVESGKGGADTIKSHHNVGGLPENIAFGSIVEPLRDLFKDEVRKVGSMLGLPDELVRRQPFPGPGLAVRVSGEITEDKLKILKEADAIFRQEVDKAGVDYPDQYFAVLTDTKSVGVKGDSRAYGATVALRAVSTDDFMTAEWTRLPYEVLAAASRRIADEIPEVTRVVYDITSKPPATVEWE